MKTQALLTTPSPLCIAIAGGGIGGLAAALALQRSGRGSNGFDVQVFESAPAFEPLGAGIQLGPNAVRILQRWGLGPGLQQVASFPDQLEVRSALDGKRLAVLPLGKEVVLRHGAPHATMHRADLHGLLLQAVEGRSWAESSSSSDNNINTNDAATKSNSGTGCVQIHLDAALHSLAQDTDTVQMGFSTGGKTTHSTFDIHADALIGADGIWSTVRKQLMPGGPPRSTGHQAFRAVLPQTALPAGLREHHSMTAWLGPGLHAVRYPVRGGQWLNMVVIVQNWVLRNSLGSPISLSMEEAAIHALPASQAIATALAASGCCPLLREMVEAMATSGGTGWQRWPLYDRAPLRSADELVKGRIALLGDAGHPMRPYLAQGAAMAIEDAAALADWLAPLAHSADASARIPAVLQLYARQRWQRNARVQAKAERNGTIFHATGPIRWGRDAALRLLGARILDLPWLYGYGRAAR